MTTAVNVEPSGQRADLGAISDALACLLADCITAADNAWRCRDEWITCETEYHTYVDLADRLETIIDQLADHQHHPHHDLERTQS